MKYTRVRGTQDIIPPDVGVWRAVENTFTAAFDRFGYREIRTPIIEHTDLFVRAVGEGSDIVSKEMYTFVDRGDRSITLRPENTASVIRAYLENGMHRRGGIQRLCYTGPMFRYDRPQAGRYRQFHQVGAEAIGSHNPAVDVEMIQLVVASLHELGFERLDLRVNSVGGKNSRAPYSAVLRDAIESVRDQVAPDAYQRYQDNPMRIFDSKDYGDKMKAVLPRISSHLVAEDADHFGEVKALLSDAGVEFTEDEYLVRGLDYYTRTVFEIYHDDRGAQSALCGGGRYDDLVAECGGAATPAIGFSAGLERIIAALPGGTSSDLERKPRIRYYVACADASASATALRAAQVLRRYGNAEVDLSGRSTKKQVQVAEKEKARFALVVHDATEMSWRDLVTHEETSVAADGLDAFVAGIESDEKE